MDAERQPRRQVQVALYWGQTPLDVISVPEKNGVVLAGSARTCAIPLPEDLLPSPDFPLLTIKDGDVTVRTGRDPFSLDEGAKLRVELGRLSLVISRVQVRSTRRAPLAQHLEPRFLNSLLLAFFLAFAFVSTLLLGPKALGHDEIQLRKNSTRYIRSLIARATPPPRLNVELLQPDLTGDRKPKMPAVGRPGKAGRRGLPDTGKRRAVKRVADDREKLSRLGVLGALGRGPGLPGTLDTTSRGLGKDLMDAIGNIDGKEPGDSGGWGGLDVQGMGPGCRGCTGSDPLFRGGPIRRSGVDDRDIPDTKYRRPKEGPVPEITHGELKMSGSLSEEIIRSTIRSYRRQIRYCYEQELIRHPELTGRIRVHFVINHRGLVQSADGVATPSLQGTNLRYCVLTKVRTWKFPRPRGGGEVEVYYPFLFSPAGRR